MKQRVTSEMFSLILGMRAAGYGAKLIGRYFDIPYSNVSTARLRQIANKIGTPEPAPLPADMIEKVGLPKEATSRDRLLLYTDKSSGCWIWQGKKTNEGYGLICVQTKYVTTHRESFRVFKGPIPNGQLVLHSCDTPLCVNPAHLSLGSRIDNAQDMIRKGRAPHMKNLAATPEQVQLIVSSNKPCIALSRETGVSYGIVRKIKAGKHWTVRQPSDVTS